MLDTAETLPSTQSINPGQLLGAAGETDDLAQSYSIGHTYVVGPTIVNSFRIGVDRTATTGYPINAFLFATQASTSGADLVLTRSDRMASALARGSTMQARIQ